MFKRAFLTANYYLSGVFKLNGNALSFGAAMNESTAIRFLGAQFSPSLIDVLPKNHIGIAGSNFSNTYVKKRGLPKSLCLAPLLIPVDNDVSSSPEQRQDDSLPKWLKPNFMQFSPPLPAPLFQRTNSMAELQITDYKSEPIYPAQKTNVNFARFTGFLGLLVMGFSVYLSRIVTSDVPDKEISNVAASSKFNVDNRMNSYFEVGNLETDNIYQYIPKVESDYDAQSCIASLSYDENIYYINMPSSYSTQLALDNQQEFSMSSQLPSDYYALAYAYNGYVTSTADLPLSYNQIYPEITWYQSPILSEKVDFVVRGAQPCQQGTVHESVLTPKVKPDKLTVKSPEKVAKKYSGDFVSFHNQTAAYQINGLDRQAYPWLKPPITTINLMLTSEICARAVSDVYATECSTGLSASYPLTAIEYTTQTSIENQSFSSSIMQINIGAKDNTVKAISTQNGRTIIDIQSANACLRVEVSMDKSRNYIMHNAVNIHKNNAEQLVVQVLSQAERSILAKRMMNFIGSIQTDIELIDDNSFQDNASSALQLNNSEQQLIEQMFVSSADDALPINIINISDRPLITFSFKSDNIYLPSINESSLNYDKVTAFKAPKYIMNSISPLPKEQIPSQLQQKNFKDLLSEIIKTGSAGDTNDPQIKLYTDKMTEELNRCSTNEEIDKLIKTMESTAQNLANSKQLVCVKNLIKDLTPTLFLFWPLALFVQSFIDKAERISNALKKVPLEQRADFFAANETVHVRQAIASHRHTSYRSDATKTDDSLVYIKKKEGEDLTVKDEVDETKAAKSFKKFKNAINDLKDSKTAEEEAHQEIQKPSI